MHFIRRTLILSLALLLLAVNFPLAKTNAETNYGEGSLIKVKNNSAVYYIGPDGKKYVFPEGKTFNTWFDDFSKVREVSTSELDKYPDGGVMPVKGGTRLITHQNTNKVYAVEPGGVLRWIPSEAKARELFGDDWYTRIMDVLPGFFASSYKVGNEISDTLPDGYLVTDGSKYYYIENGKKRLISRENLSLNNLKEVNALRIKNINRYGDDNSINDKRDSIANFVPPIKDLEEKKVVVCHNNHNISISKNALKAHLAIGDTLGRCDADKSPDIEPTEPEEVEPGNWCSVLLGLFSSSSLGYASDGAHAILDLNNDGVVNLGDYGMVVTLYNSGNNSSCLSYIENQYSQEDYEDIDWCNGLVQGISDNYGDVSPFDPFDLNDDDRINLSDLPIVARYVYDGDQAQCYGEYVPYLPAMSDSVDNDVDNDGYNSLSSGGTDCNDNSASINPGAIEVCNDGIDQDCSGDDLQCTVSDDVNMIQNSWDFSGSSWDGDLIHYPKSRFVFTGGQSDPFGTNKAFKIASNFAASWQQRDSTPNIILDYNKVTASLYVKQGTATNVIFGLNDVSHGTEYEQTFNFNNGVPSWTSGTNDGYSVTNIGNGWYRLSMTLDLNSRNIKGSSFKGRITPVGTSSTIGEYTYLTGFQLESGNSPTVYIEKPSSGTGTNIDDQSPSTPTNFSASASGNQISLSWSPSTDNVAIYRYHIERSTSASSGFSELTTTSNSSYVNSNLNYSTSYYYRVRAEDSSGNYSAYSSIVSATTGSSGNPTNPGDAPVINSVSSNSLVNGASFIISGTDFGAKVSVNGVSGPPVLWDNFEDGSAGALVQPTSAKWDRVRSDNTSGPRYYLGAIDNSMGVRTGSGIVDGVTGGTTRTLIEDDEFRDLYLDYYIRADRGEGLLQRSSKQVMIWSANVGISEDGPNTAFWQITQGGEEPGFALSQYACIGNASISYANGWGVNEFLTPRHVQIEIRQQSSLGAGDGYARMWYDGQLVTDQTFGDPQCDPGKNYLDNLFIGHYQDVDSAVEPIYKWISCPGDDRCDQCPEGASGCSVNNDDWLPARQDEFFYDNIYIDKSISRVEIGNSANYASATRREIQIPSAWSGNSITFTANKGGFSSNDQLYLFVTNSSGEVSPGYPVSF